ncbi:MAG: HU family DNA-binding protein, partial [Rikenellaceae bacterium]
FMSTHLKSGGEVSINNFGRFKHRYYKPRKGCHPKTGESINICDRAVIQFTPSPSIKVSDEVKAMLAQK